MILIGYRHGLRATELCDLQWSQVELATGRLHVRRAKNGSPSVHPMQGDEIRALRRLQREQGASSHVFMTERDRPMTPKACVVRPDRSASEEVSDHAASGEGSVCPARRVAASREFFRSQASSLSASR
jgi:integrase